jgi:hypothetical protein
MDSGDPAPAQHETGKLGGSRKSRGKKDTKVIKPVEKEGKNKQRREKKELWAAIYVVTCLSVPHEDYSTTEKF